jgi:hypothetical protein
MSRVYWERSRLICQLGSVVVIGSLYYITPMLRWYLKYNVTDSCSIYHPYIPSFDPICPAS